MSSRKLILRNGQSPGDIVMLTAAVRDLHLAFPGRYQTDVRTPFPELWLHNPYLTSLAEDAPDVQVVDAHYPIIDNSNDGAYHFVHGFTLDIGATLGVTIPVTRLRGDLHLSAAEVHSANPVATHLRTQAAPYWLICTGGKTDYTAKWWIPEYAQEVVDYYYGRIWFVQFGAAGTQHHHPPLDRVINLVGQTTLRELIMLIYHADGVVCPVSAAMHIAAAVPRKPGHPMNKPCVVTAGGREPSFFTFYTNHQYLHANGAMRCCGNGGCWKSRTTPLGDGDPKDDELCLDTVPFHGRLVQRCMHALVTPADVIRAIEKYYDGGMLGADSRESSLDD